MTRHQIPFIPEMTCQPPRRTFRQWLHRRRLLTENAYLRFRIRHGRKSELQRDWESGDPARVARVQQIADRIRAELAARRKWAMTMQLTVVNLEEIPGDLPPGVYCCRLESATWQEMKVRFVPGSQHQPGDCLIQLTKEGDVRPGRPAGRRSPDGLHILPQARSPQRDRLDPRRQGRSRRMPLVPRVQHHQGDGGSRQ